MHRIIPSFNLYINNFQHSFWTV